MCGRQNRNTCEREQIGDAAAIDDAGAMGDADALDQLIGVADWLPDLTTTT